MANRSLTMADVIAGSAERLQVIGGQREGKPPRRRLRLVISLGDPTVAETGGPPLFPGWPTDCWHIARTPRTHLPCGRLSRDVVGNDDDDYQGTPRRAAHRVKE